VQTQNMPLLMVSGISTGIPVGYFSGIPVGHNWDPTGKYLTGIPVDIPPGPQ
jgi:hypothetical protein